MASMHHDKHLGKLLYSVAAIATAAPVAAVVVVAAVEGLAAVDQEAVLGRIALVLIPWEVTIMIQNWE